jgi:5-methylcytosine-specific restriction endonuclease McrBC regulatory subunit McrC
LRQETEQSRYWTKEEENHSLDLGKKITIRPDILIYLDDSPYLVVDAKYKLSASQEDLYQMLAYCHAVGINQAVLVHPGSEASPLGAITMRGPGNIRVDYQSLNLSGGPAELEAQGKILVTKILQTIPIIG